MPLISTLFIIYGVLLIAGGIMGFVKAGSSASLISGICTGILSFIVAFVKMDARPALLFGTILPFAVACIFILRYIKTRKAMPAIPMIVISDALAVYALVSLLLLKK